MSIRRLRGLGFGRLPRSVPVNTGAVLVARLFGAGASTVVAIVAAHRLGPSAFGQFAAIVAAGFLASTVITFGTDTDLVRAVAGRDPTAGQLVRAVARFQFLGAGAMVAVSLVAMAASLLPSAAVIQALGLFPLAAITVCGAVLRAPNGWWSWRSPPEGVPSHHW